MVKRRSVTVVSILPGLGLYMALILTVVHIRDITLFTVVHIRDITLLPVVPVYGPRDGSMRNSIPLLRTMESIPGYTHLSPKDHGRHTGLYTPFS